MKFFDLEMGDSLAFGKKGGRDVSYSHITSNGGCDTLQYTHGNDWNSCMANTYKKQTFSCQTTHELLIQEQ